MASNRAVRQALRTTYQKRSNEHVTRWRRGVGDLDLWISVIYFSFLVATKRLYKRVCPSVGPSVAPSVAPSVGWLVGDAFAFRPSRSDLGPCIRPCFDSRRKFKIARVAPFIFTLCIHSPKISPKAPVVLALGGGDALRFRCSSSSTSIVAAGVISARISSSATPALV